MQYLNMIRKDSNKQSGFVLPIILIVLLLVAVGYGVSQYGNKKSSNVSSPVPVAVDSTSTPTVISSATPILKPKIVIKTSTPTSKPLATSVSSSTSTKTVLPIPTGLTNSVVNTLTSPSPTISTDTSGTITVSTTSVNVTISRSGSTGSLYGSGFNIISQGATGWSLYNNDGTSGQGFYETSGGITPGGSQNIRTYINSNKTNGVYSGSYLVKYSKNGTWQSGPTVTYSITLTD